MKSSLPRKTTTKINNKKLQSNKSTNANKKLITRNSTLTQSNTHFSTTKSPLVKTQFKNKNPLKTQSLRFMSAPAPAHKFNEDEIQNGLKSVPKWTRVCFLFFYFYYFYFDHFVWFLILTLTSLLPPPSSPSSPSFLPPPFFPSMVDPPPHF